MKWRESFSYRKVVRGGRRVTREAEERERKEGQKLWLGAYPVRSHHPILS